LLQALGYKKNTDNMDDIRALLDNIQRLYCTPGGDPDVERALEACFIRIKPELRRNIVQLGSRVRGGHLGAPIDPPGTLSAEGPRHSNDHAAIADISVIPPTDELVATREPYLPRNNPNAEHHLPPNSFERTVDTHFRLLRQEVMQPVQRAAQYLQQVCQNSATFPVHTQTITDRGKSFRVTVYHNALGVGIDANDYSMVKFVLEVDELMRLAESVSFDQHQRHYEEQIGALRQGNVVMICPNPTTLSFESLVPKLIVCRIATTPRHVIVSKTCRNRIRVSLDLLGSGEPRAGTALLKMLFERNVTESVLIDCWSSFFAVEPILSALQVKRRVFGCFLIKNVHQSIDSQRGPAWCDDLSVPTTPPGHVFPPPAYLSGKLQPILPVQWYEENVICRECCASSTTL
jgi:hypothetical protein